MSLTPLLQRSTRRTFSSPGLLRGSRGGVERSFLPRLCDAVLDVPVIVLCTWTVVYHICLVLRLGVWWAVGFELGALTASLLSWRWSHRRMSDVDRRPAPDPASDTRTPAGDTTRFNKVLLVTVVVAGSAAAALVAIGAYWPPISALWLIAAVAGTLLAAMRLRSYAGTASAEHRQDPDREPSGHAGAVIALVWATALAVLSLFARRGDPDDLYYVNLAQWVVEHGTFPLRDTIFSDLTFPMSSWPPIASYDGLAGTLGMLSGVPAASVVYLVFTPVVTFLSVVALWRLLRQWHVRSVGIALSLALTFLLFDGGPGYAAPGNLFLTRIWQGKVILLCLLVPTLLVYAARYVERPTTERTVWLFAGGTAAVGLTTSAMFLVPLIALAGVAPLGLRKRGRALVGFVAMAAYPLAAGVVTLMVDGRSADLFASRGLFRFDPAWFGPAILRDGPVAFIAVAAVLIGAIFIPSQVARVTVSTLTVILGVTFIPGVTQVAFDLVGLGPTLWRVSWIVPIAALVGMFGVGLGSYGKRRGFTVAVPVVVAMALIVSGMPIWSPSMTALDRSPQWKLNRDYVASARRIIDIARPGDVVLAPEGLAITITVMTTRAKTVAPRSYFMDYLRDDPRFHYWERQILVGFANDETDSRPTLQILRALTAVDVDLVCLPAAAQQRIGFLRANGYQLATFSAAHTCLRP